MTKVKIEILHILSIALIAAGLLFFLKGSFEIGRYSRAIPLDKVCSTNCKQGMYVIGDITDCVKKRISNLGNGEVIGWSAEHIKGVKVYKRYVVPVSNQQFIQVMIRDTNVIDDMNCVVAGEKEKVHFEGKIVSASDYSDLTWYDAIEGFDSGNIIKTYVVWEKNINFEYQCMWFGIFTFVIGACILYANKDGMVCYEKKEER